MYRLLCCYDTPNLETPVFRMKEAYGWLVDTNSCLVRRLCLPVRDDFLTDA